MRRCYHANAALASRQAEAALNFYPFAFIQIGQSLVRIGNLLRPTERFARKPDAVLVRQFFPITNTLGACWFSVALLDCFRLFPFIPNKFKP